MVKWNCKEFGIEWRSSCRDLGVQESPLCWHRWWVAHSSLHSKIGLTAEYLWRPAHRALWSRTHISVLYKALCCNKPLTLVWTEVHLQAAVHETLIPSLACMQPTWVSACSSALAQENLHFASLHTCRSSCIPYKHCFCVLKHSMRAQQHCPALPSAAPLQKKGWKAVPSRTAASTEPDQNPVTWSSLKTNLEKSWDMFTSIIRRLDSAAWASPPCPVCPPGGWWPGLCPVCPPGGCDQVSALATPGGFWGWVRAELSLSRWCWTPAPAPLPRIAPWLELRESARRWKGRECCPWLPCLWLQRGRRLPAGDHGSSPCKRAQRGGTLLKGFCVSPGCFVPP